MKTLIDEVTSIPEGRRDFVRGYLGLLVQDRLCRAMKRAKVSKAQLDARLGKGRGYVRHFLEGSGNRELFAIADMFDALGMELTVGFKQSAFALVKEERT